MNTNKMEDGEINSIIARIEAAVPIEGAIAHVETRELKIGGEIKYPENYLIANRAGYLRLAAFMLRATVAPYEGANSSVIAIVPQDDLDKSADFWFGSCERREDIEKEDRELIQHKNTIWDTLFILSYLVFFIGMCALLIIGVFTVWNWIF